MHGLRNIQDPLALGSLRTENVQRENMNKTDGRAIHPDLEKHANVYSHMYEMGFSP